MLNFEFSLPTRIYFGKDTELSVGKYIKTAGESRVLLHYGGESAKKSGLLDKIKKSLDDEGVFYVELGGVKPNPLLSKVYEGIELCKKQDLHFVLAVGGGSVIDSAKTIAAGVCYDGDVWDFFWPRPTKDIKKALKVGTVLTIPAAGSETSDSAVITNENGMLKRSYHSDLSRPVFAVMNPSLAGTLPPYQVACGVCDMMCHILERYFTNTKNVDLTDKLCEGALKSIISNAQAVVKNPADYDAMAEIMWAGSIAHNGILDTGRIGDWASHSIEHELSSFYGVAHGEGLAIVFPHWMKYTLSHDENRFAMFAENVMGISGKTTLEAAEKGISALSEFWKSLGLKSKISELGGKTADLPALADKTATSPVTKTLGNFVPLTRDDIFNILSSAF